jgi:2-methylisocitrate lyase-like PEP mutase family enzyme
VSPRIPCAGSRFRALLQEGTALSLPSVFDPLGALIAQEVGFPAVALGGFGLGAHMGSSEPLLSLTDVATITSRVALFSGLPAIVDAGAGWGDPLHARNAVRTLERAGAAGLHIEDQLFPKRAHYHAGIEHVIPLDEMLFKIDACLKAREDDDFVIIARTDSIATDGYDEAIRRGRRFADAGADLVMLFPGTPTETMNAPRDLPGIPLVYVNSSGNRSGRGVYPVEDLSGWGWQVAYDAITVVNVYAQATRAALTQLARTGVTGADPDQMREIRAYIERVIGLEDAYALERETVERDAPSRRT